MSDDARAARRVLGLLDLTNLNEDCDEAAIDVLCKKSRTAFGDVAAVCVYPAWVPAAKQRLKRSNVRVATVANFPDGAGDGGGAPETARRAIEAGADEIDVVLPWRALLDGQADAALDVVRRTRATVPADRFLKVILETGMIGDPTKIAEAARIAIDGGADFIKTSTGKTPVSATPEAVRVMLQVIKASDRRVGLKPSGGIRTLSDAAKYLALADAAMGPEWASVATFRFGASGLLDDLLRVLNGESRLSARSTDY